MKCDIYFWYSYECLALAEGLHQRQEWFVWVTQVGGYMEVLTSVASPGCPYLLSLCQDS